MLHRNLFSSSFAALTIRYSRPVVSEEGVGACLCQTDLALKLGPGELDNIETRNKKLDTCLTEVVGQWLSKMYDTEKFGDPSWSLLAEAVAHPAGGNNNALAMEISEGKNFTCSKTETACCRLVS